MADGIFNVIRIRLKLMSHSGIDDYSSATKFKIQKLIFAKYGKNVGNLSITLLHLK